MADYPHQADDPMTRILRLLNIALDFEAPESVRRAAWEKLDELPPGLVRDLAGDAEWELLEKMVDEGMFSTPPREEDDREIRPEDAEAVEELLTSLDAGPQGPPEEDAGIEGEWAPPREECPPPSTSWEDPKPDEEPPPSLSRRSRREKRWLAVYDRDLRRLINADFADELPVLDRPDDVSRPLRERAAAYAAARKCPPRPSELFVRSLPWTTTNHGLVFADLYHRWPDRMGLLRAFLDASLHEPAHRGMPPLVARALEEAAAERPDRWAWLEATLADAARRLESEIHEFLDVESMQRVHFELRLELARQVRRGEIMDPRLVGSVELAASVQMLRTAAFKDLLRAWQEGEGEIESVLKVYRRYDTNAEMLSELALRGILWQPDPIWVEELAPEDREALAFSRSVRRRSPKLASGGVFDLLNL